jgi:hypothetical protein
MYAPRFTPSIEVTIGRETRLYHAFITTHRSRSTLRRQSRCTPRRSRRVRQWPRIPITVTTAREASRRGLVLVDGTELDWQRAAYREGRQLFAPCDPVLVGLNTCSTGSGRGSVRPRRSTRTRSSA